MKEAERRWQWGAQVHEDAVSFRLWAPAQPRVAVAIEGEPEPLTMNARDDGWHELRTKVARHGSLYRFQLADGLRVPDPASRFQPQDVTGPSEVIDASAHAWTDRDWFGRPWHTAVIYELHVGAFTPQGTFTAIIERLPHLASLGVTALQLMPIADFPGDHNWGYDGVLPYAPDSSYGRPEELKALVDAAHRAGLMVFLDVVYNHFGPEGNYIGVYAPQFFTERHHTPWGAAINFDGPGCAPVRAFFIENALHWLEEFHLDGLRFDAVHHLLDDSPVHILEELATTVRERFTTRHVHLILENEENQASRLARTADGAARTFTAQWNDDLHHVLHTAATHEGHGYYVDYLGDRSRLGRALAEGFAFQGEVMPYRGSPRGEPSAHLPPTAFVGFIQNHDQIGNRAFGERLRDIASAEALRAISAVYLLLPQIPMLFMGEEWNAREPFVFFCDFKGELATAIREGRKREFAKFPAFQQAHPDKPIPDPDAPTTFTSAKLDWSALDTEDSAQWRERYRNLLRIRRRDIVPWLPHLDPKETRVTELGATALRVQWRLGERAHLVLICNLSDADVSDVPVEEGRLLWSENPAAPERSLAPWSVYWYLRD